MNPCMSHDHDAIMRPLYAKRWPLLCGHAAASTLWSGSGAHRVRYRVCLHSSAHSMSLTRCGCMARGTAEHMRMSPGIP